MRHNYRLTGDAFGLRPVSTEDAAFIYRLRRDAHRSRYLHSISGTVEDQKKWLESYFERENDYYFVIVRTDDERREGLVGLYDILKTSAEWGRWILASGSYAALESAFLIYRFGFELLGCERIFCRTLTDNEQVLSFHRNFGATEECRLESDFTINGQSYDAVRHAILRQDWPQISKHNLPLMSRLARKLHGAIRQ